MNHCFDFMGHKIMNKCTKLTNFFVSAIVRNFSQSALDFNIPLAITVSQIEMIFLTPFSRRTVRTLIVRCKISKSNTEIDFRVGCGIIEFCKLLAK